MCRKRISHVGENFKIITNFWIFKGVFFNAVSKWICLYSKWTSNKMITWNENFLHLLFSVLWLQQYNFWWDCENVVLMVFQNLICFAELCVAAADAAPSAHQDQTTITIFLLLFLHQQVTVPLKVPTFAKHLHFAPLYFKTRNKGGGTTIANYNIKHGYNILCCHAFGSVGYL